MRGGRSLRNRVGLRLRGGGRVETSYGVGDRGEVVAEARRPAGPGR